MAEALNDAPERSLDQSKRATVSRGRVAVIAGAIGIGIGMIVSTIAAKPVPRLLWNASASAPIGLYLVLPGAPLEIGDMVIAEPPAAIKLLAASRHYLPSSVPLVKRVAALAGARVCARGASILIDGRLGAKRLAADPHGRVLPWWQGCRQLQPGEALLLNAPANSFDGRYFGPVGAGAIVGKAVPLWLR